MQQLLLNSPRCIEIRQITHADSSLILEGYALLQETLGVDSVENLGSFMATVSPLTDPAAAPKIVCALSGDTLAGITVGAYLRNLNMGFIAYSGVKDSFRQRGVYKALRTELIELLNLESRRGRFETCPHAPNMDTCGISRVISELEGDGWLYNKYVHDWNAYDLPCDYEQPEVQGLPGRPMKLVLQPLASETPPDHDQLVEIVREIYERVYRISDVDASPSFRRITASIKN